MRVAEVVEITQGELLSHPSISAFGAITTNLERLKRGDLFIASEPALLKEAIARGAYGVIFSGTAEIFDDEIAWIRVGSLDEALLRLLRYEMISNDSRVVLLPPIEWKIAQNLLAHKRAFFFEGKPLALFEHIRESYEWYFFCEPMYERVSPNIIRAAPPLETPFEVTSHTLFDTKLFFDGHHHTLALPQLFLKPLANVLHLFNTHHLPFDLAKFTPIDSLYPCFLNAKSKITKYGQSNRVAIAERDLESFERYAAYLKINAKWARILFVIPAIYAELFENFNLVRSYENEKELLAILIKEEYNFALVLGVGLSFLEEHLKEQPHESLLFDF